MISCEQFLEVELPDQEPRLVLNALLEPTSTLKVFLTKSRGVLEGGDFYDDQFELVEGANVFIKAQDGQILPLVFVDNSKPWETDAHYLLDGYEFKEGETYGIFAEKSGLPSISSQQEIPKNVNIKSIDMVNLGPDGSFDSHNIFEVSIKFEDPSERNFYEISGQIFGSEIMVIDGDSTLFYYNSDLSPEPVNPIYKKDHLMRNVILFTDVLLNGPDSEIVFRTSIIRNRDLEVTINFSHVTEAFYRYYDTADLQRYNNGDILSQPVLVYNNITNGLGIFKARNTDQRVIEMRVED